MRLQVMEDGDTEWHTLNTGFDNTPEERRRLQRLRDQWRMTYDRFRTAKFRIVR